MKEIKIDVKVKGAAPLLMNKFIENKLSDKRKKVYVPEEESEKKTYRTKDGKLYLPSKHFKASMVKAGTEFKMKGQKTYKDYIKAGIIIEPEEIILDQQEYVIHEEPVVIKRNRVMSWRPKFPKWSCGFSILIIDDMICQSALKEILNEAGRFKGVGDYRPEYGRFKIVEWKIKN